MHKTDLTNLNLPDSPGVYFFRGENDEILYIGKATCLRDRVRSYWNDDLVITRGPKIARMLEAVKTVEVTVVDSVLEALILEATLIKKHQPTFNSRDKDDKSFNYVVITTEAFPRVLVYRGRNLLKAPPKEPIRALYGPFPQGGSLKIAMDIVRRLFPFRDRCTPGSGTPCFNRQIGLCPGVCTGEISKRDYQRQIRHLALFFEGKKSALLNRLKKDMQQQSAALEFERAAEIKRTIFSLTHIQDVALIKDDPIRYPSEDSAEGRLATPFRIEAYDVAHISGQYMVGVMVVIENGVSNKSAYRKFKIKSVPGSNDTACLKEILRRRFTHSEWRKPHLIVVDGSTAQRNAALSVLRETTCDIPVIGVVKDERHKPKSLIGPKDLRNTHEKAILLSNSEAHRFAITYHRHLREKIR